MFTSTMNDAEIQREARKDFFELSTKVRIAIERYKERHLKPHCIDTRSTPVPLYFKINNPDCIMGRYYKTTDIDIEEGTHKKFWIAPEGIYVTDYIEGMLTYITFMDKDDLSPLKKQVYEEEIVWDLMCCIVDKNRSEEERSKASFRLASTANLGHIFERFAKRNIADDDNGEKQELLLRIRKEMAGQEAMFQEVKEHALQREKEKLRRNRVTGALNTNSLIDKVEIKSYDIQQ